MAICMAELKGLQGGALSENYRILVLNSVVEVFVLKLFILCVLKVLNPLTIFV